MRIPFGEFAPDQADQNREVAAVAENVIGSAYGYKPLRGKGSVARATISSGNPKSVYYRDVDPLTSTKLITTTHSNPSTVKIYVDSTDATNASGLSTLIGGTTGVEFVKWDDAILVYGNIDTPQKITSSVITAPATNKTADIANSPSALTAAKINQFVVLGSTKEASVTTSIRVRWSAFDDYESWTVGTNQSDFQDLPEGGRVVKIIGGEVGLILQQTQVVRMTYVGSPLIFQFDVIEGGRGCASRDSVVEVGGNVFYLSNEGFAVIVNQSSSELIGKGKIDSFFWRDCANKDQIIGVYDELSGSIFWFYPTVSGPDSNLIKDGVIIFNIASGKWSTASFGNVYAAGKYIKFSGSSDDFGYHAIGIYTSTDYNELSGSPLAATIETGEYSQEDALTEITEIRPLIDGTATVTTETRNLLSDSVTSTGPTSTDSSGKANVRTNARYTRIKCTTSGDFTQAVGVEVKARKGGKR